MDDLSFQRRPRKETSPLVEGKVIEIPNSVDGLFFSRLWICLGPNSMRVGVKRTKLSRLTSGSIASSGERSFSSSRATWTPAIPPPQNQYFLASASSRHP